MPNPFVSLRARGSVYARAAIFLAFSVAGCKDGTGSGSGTDRDVVASVSVAGAPTGPLLTGATVQLVAMPVTATGAAVAGETVTWSSSDTLVAKVGPQGMVTAVGAGPVTITATVERKQGGVTLDVRAGGTMGPEGGTLTVLGGAATVVLPPTALAAPTTLLLRPATSPAANPRMVPGTAFELGPEGMTFTRPATLTLRYDPARIPAGVAPSALQLYVMSNGAWTVVRGSRVSTAERTVTGAIGGAGIYAVAATVAEQVAVRGSVAGGVLYTTQRAQLGVVALDVNRDTIHGRMADWTSSDPARATVDSTGMVTALAAGAVTITATVDVKSASTAIVIITRPAASWSETSDWTTYQGDAGHRGEIAATLDPVVFREQWTATLAAGVPLNAVATGDGMVFATMVGRGSQHLWALDAATGAQRWMRNFGYIASVQPPASGNGRVYVQTGGHEDSFLWSFDARDGTQRFRTAYGNQWSTWEAPVVADSGVYAGGGTYGGMSRFDAITGTRSYFIERPQYDGWTPAVAGGLVFSFDRNGLTATNSRSGTTAYQINDSRLPLAGTPVVTAANRVLGTTPSSVFAIDLANRRVAWMQPMSVEGALAVSNGLVYVPSSSKVDVVQESDGRLLWSWTIPDGPSWLTSVLVTRNILFVSTHTTTYAVDLAARRHTWVYPAGGQLSMSKEGLLLIARPNGRLTAIDVR